jgi:signal transduction histidine kinase
MYELGENIIVILINLLGLFLASWVYFDNRKQKINQIFALLVFLTLLWIDFGCFANLTEEKGLALLFIRLTFAIASFWFVVYYFFVENLSFKRKSNIFLDRIVFFAGAVLFFLSAFTNFIIEKIEFYNWGVNPVLGSGKTIFYPTVFFLTLLIIGKLIKKYLIVPQAEKLKIQYFLLGTLIYAGFNVFFNIILPVVRGSYQFYQVGNYSAIFLLSFTAHAIVKQNLFGIRVVLTQLLVSVIAILLFVQILGSGSTFEYIWKSVLFLTFLFFGYSLVKSVIREIKLRQDLEKAYEDLQKLDKAKSEFISIASHQLRTPLTAIKGYISMMLEGSYGEVSGQLKGKLQNVFQSNERLIRLINDLLNVSKIESGKIELVLSEASLDDIILSVVDTLSLEAKKKKISLKWEKSKKPLQKINIDADKIREVISNLVDNAIKYTQKGEIKITTQDQKESVLIKVSDTGEGLSEGEKEKIFQSFSRGTAGTQFYTEGSGLGLYIAKQFVIMHKGKIWVESAGKGQGTTFYIELPRTK